MHVAVLNGDMPVALSREDIVDLVGCSGAAARRCREAGVDVLSVHAAHSRTGRGRRARYATA